jgi:hypothetical protein
MGAQERKANQADLLENQGKTNPGLVAREHIDQLGEAKKPVRSVA